MVNSGAREWVPGQPPRHWGWPPAHVQPPWQRPWIRSTSQSRRVPRHLPAAPLALQCLRRSGQAGGAALVGTSAWWAHRRSYQPRVWDDTLSIGVLGCGCGYDGEGVGRG